MLYTIQYWQWQYRVKANSHTDPLRGWIAGGVEGGRGQALRPLQQDERALHAHGVLRRRRLRYRGGVRDALVRAHGPVRAQPPVRNWNQLKPPRLRRSEARERLQTRDTQHCAGVARGR